MQKKFGPYLILEFHLPFLLFRQIDLSRPMMIKALFTIPSDHLSMTKENFFVFNFIFVVFLAQISDISRIQNRISIILISKVILDRLNILKK